MVDFYGWTIYIVVYEDNLTVLILKPSIKLLGNEMDINEKKYIRGYEEVKCFLSKMNFHISKDSNIAKRERAVHEVLRRIPEDHYKKLVEEDMAWGIQWVFIGMSSYMSKLQAFLSDKQRPDNKYSILIIIPQYYECEQISDEIVEVAVAHELAHIVLGHYGKCINSEEYKKDEEECDRLVAAWGFIEEQEKEKAFFSEFKVTYDIQPLQNKSHYQ